MFLDQGSLFFAAGICAVALAMTMLHVWFQNREDRFLVGWTFAMVFIGGGVILYYSVESDRTAAVTLAFTMEAIGFVAVYAAALLFTGKRIRKGTLLAVALVGVLPVTFIIAVGFDGLGIAVYNFLSAVLLAMTAVQYWRGRAESPSSIIALSALYSLTALSFLACGAMLLLEGKWVLDAHPDNWAEQFNAVMSIAGITGIGALSLGLNHARAARRHRLEAQTDALTGLVNRRALFDSLSRSDFGAGHAVIAFDLDQFKALNDQYGHAAGDEIMRCFADALRQDLRPGDIAARTGGEEFVLVMYHAPLHLATGAAERIRKSFAACNVETAKGWISGTVSAGIAVSKMDERFEDILLRADMSLYRAKNGGRNRVVTELAAA